MSNETNGNAILPLKLDVSVRPIEPKNNLLAFAKVTINDSFVVDGFRVMNGEKGMFVNMPSTKDGKGEYKDVCHPITADFRQQLNSAILDGYDTAIEKMQSTVIAAGTAKREAPEKSSILGDMKNKQNEINARSETKDHAAPKKDKTAR